MCGYHAIVIVQNAKVLCSCSAHRLDRAGDAHARAYADRCL